MGTSRWSSNDYVTYASATSYATKSVGEVFGNRTIQNYLNPVAITLRESVDSDANPNSTPVILALDVTGSMGQYAHEIAVTHLPKLMTRIIDEKPITDPHIMFMGIDDVHCGSPAALQASQFETDIRILEQLRDMYLVGRGGGNSSESYDLAWYFAANKTRIDSFEKRNQPGFLFTFGDEEAPYENLTEQELVSVFGPGQYEATTPRAALSSAQQKYQVFHVVIEQGDYCNRSLNSVKRTWTKVLGNNVLFVRDSKYLVDVVIATLKIAMGEPINDVINSSDNSEELKYAFSNSL